MALPGSGALAASQINTELGYSSTALLSLDAAAVRTLAGKGTVGSQINFSDFYGKSSGFTFTQTISSNTTNYNLKSAAITAGWDQAQALSATVTINNGIYVYSTSTGTYAFDTGSTFPAGTTLTLINNGIIQGCGGTGGAGNGNAGVAGGPAFIARHAITVTNNGTIGGGGGGGGGGGQGYGP